MLVLSRKIGQQIRIGDQITLTIVKTQGQTVRVGIEAPRDVRVVRAELPPLAEAEETPETAAARLAEPARSLCLVGTDASRNARLPGKDATPAPRRTQPSHPLRWTVANMRERVESQTSPRTTTTTSAGQHV